MVLLQILYPYLKFTLGTLYPAYKTWKSLKRKDETVRRRWMKYWVSFGAFQLFEFFADITLAFLLPFYAELKLLAILWLVLGTKLVFDSIVNRELTKWEKTIDRALTKTRKARDEVVAAVWHEVSRCSVQILSAVVSAALVNTSGKLADTNNNNNNNNNLPNPSELEQQTSCEQQQQSPLKVPLGIHKTRASVVKREPVELHLEQEDEEDGQGAATTDPDETLPMDAEDTRC